MSAVELVSVVLAKNAKYLLPVDGNAEERVSYSKAICKLLGKQGLSDSTGTI